MQGDAAGMAGSKAQEAPVGRSSPSEPSALTTTARSEFQSGSERLELAVPSLIRAKICQVVRTLSGGESVNVRKKMGLVTVSVGALLLSACGSNSLGGEPAGSSAPSVSVSQNEDLSAKLPESIKSAGVIKIGTDASYAPNEFLAADGKTVQGMDVDVFNAVAAKFGVKTEWQPADFGSIINGVNGKKYDIGISSFTINDERKQAVTMVSYFSAGTQWATAKGNPK